MRVLVTGGAGYIGGTVANALLNAGHEVVIYDNLCHARRDLIPARAEFIEGDIADREKLEQIFEARPFRRGDALRRLDRGGREHEGAGGLFPQ